MFKKTRFSLVILNAVVFFLILNVFGGAIYIVMDRGLTAQADDALRNFSEHLKQEHYHDVFLQRDHHPDNERSPSSVLWDTKGNILFQTAQQTIPKQESTISFDLPVGTEKYVTLDDTNDRVLRLKIRVSDIDVPGIDITNETSATYLILDLVYNMNPEQNMLHHLLIVIGIGAFLSVILAIVSGLFLANRALIPIQKAWEKQQRFVADASHELRTPLSVMKIQLERLFHHPQHTIENESEAISVVLHETGRISKLVGNLLTLARSDSNETQIITEPFSLHAVIEMVVKHFQQLAILKDINIQAQIEPKLEIVGDKERIHQLVVILIDNAFKYTPESGRIEIACNRQGKYVELRVTDSGTGIAKEDIPRVFDRFYRGDKVRTRKEEGTGLGLSIAKWIVEAHKGTIRIESELGKGTSVRVTLPTQLKI